MDEREAATLGRIDGTAAAENLLDSHGIDALRSCVDSRSWLTAARQVLMHRDAGVPEHLREAYYGSYAAAATARGQWLLSLARELANDTGSEPPPRVELATREQRGNAGRSV